jgi:hypothetical protein
MLPGLSRHWLTVYSLRLPLMLEWMACMIHSCATTWAGTLRRPASARTSAAALALMVMVSVRYSGFGLGIVSYLLST